MLRTSSRGSHDSDAAVARLEATYGVPSTAPERRPDSAFSSRKSRRSSADFKQDDSLKEAATASLDREKAAALRAAAEGLTSSIASFLVQLEATHGVLEGLDAVDRDATVAVLGEVNVLAQRHELLQQVLDPHLNRTSQPISMWPLRLHIVYTRLTVCPSLRVCWRYCAYSHIFALL